MFKKIGKNISKTIDNVKKNRLSRAPGTLESVNPRAGHEGKPASAITSSPSAAEGEEYYVEEELRVICRAISICEYHPSEAEKFDDIRFLDFDKGVIIDILEQDSSGWWEGILNDVIGVFPGSYVRIIETFDTPREDGSSTARSTSTEEAGQESSEVKEESSETKAAEESIPTAEPAEPEQKDIDTPASATATTPEAASAPVAASEGVKKYEAEIAKLKRELNDRNREAKKWKDQAESLKKQAGEKEVLEVKLQAAEDELKKVKADLATKSGIISKLESDVIGLKATNTTEKQARERLEQALQKSEKEVEEAWAAQNELLQQLQQFKDGSRQTSVHEERSQEDFARKLEEEINLRVQSEDMLRSAEFELVEIRQAKQRLESELANMNIEIELHRADVNKILKEKKDLMALVDEVKQDLKITRTACVAQSKEIEHYIAINAELSSVNAQLNDEIAALREQTTANTISQNEERLNQTINQLATAKRRLESQINDLKRTVANITTEKEALKQDYEQQIEQLSADLDAALASKSEAEQRLNQFKSINSSKGDSVADQELVQIKQKYERVVAEKRKVDEELRLIRTTPESVLAKELQQLRSRLAEAKQENQQLQATLNKQQEAQANIVSIENQTTELRTRLEKELEEKRILEEKEKNLRVELGIANRKLSIQPNTARPAQYARPPPPSGVRFPKTSAPSQPGAPRPLPVPKSASTAAPASGSEPQPIDSSQPAAPSESSQPAPSHPMPRSQKMQRPVSQMNMNSVRPQPKNPSLTPLDLSEPSPPTAAPLKRPAPPGVGGRKQPFAGAPKV